MTGKELILYILDNDLVNEDFFKDGRIYGFMNEEEAAIKFNVGIESIRVLYALDMIKGFRIDDHIYFRKDLIYPGNEDKNI